MAMRALILGGTRFIGRQIAEAVLERGHELTLFHRGQTGTEHFPAAEHVLGDRRSDNPFRLLSGQGFDFVVDTSAYFPADVRALRPLADAIGHYTFMSSLSVLEEPVPAGADEEAPVWELTGPVPEEIDSASTYGALKVLCEREAHELMKGRALIVRAGFVIGPHDYSDRFVYWPRRLEQGGLVLAGSNPRQPVQLIDVRDLATWIVDAAERGLTGTYNATGPAEPLTLAALLEACAASTGGEAELVWATDELLLAHGIEPAQELPFWLPATHDNFCRVANKKAFNEGLEFRELAATIRDTIAWDRERPRESTGRLPAAKEAEIIAQTRAA
jgi:nucleoside-diphosphate-sugar epimerase